MAEGEHVSAAEHASPVRLRGHHFLCILTYRGLGYTPAFVANMSAIIRQIGAGRPVILQEGPDDICNGLTQDCRAICDHDCTLADTMAIDQTAIAAVADYLPTLTNGAFVLGKETITTLRAAFSRGTIRAACARCPWSDLCDSIAENGFRDVALFTPDPDLLVEQAR